MRTRETRRWATTSGNVGDTPEPPDDGAWSLAACASMGETVWWYWEEISNVPDFGDAT